jgi:hypothetical protein
VERYGDSHRGVCLKFKTTNLPGGESALVLRQVNAIDGTGTFKYNYNPQPFQEVLYADRYQEIYFFRSVFTLIPRQLAFWFRGSTGELSATGQDLLQGTEEWRRQYWGDLPRVGHNQAEGLATRARVPDYPAKLDCRLVDSDREDAALPVRGRIQKSPWRIKTFSLASTLADCRV